MSVSIRCISAITASIARSAAAGSSCQTSTAIRVPMMASSRAYHSARATAFQARSSVTARQKRRIMASPVWTICGPSHNGYTNPTPVARGTCQPPCGLSEWDFNRNDNMKLFSKTLGALVAASLLSMPAQAVTHEEATIDQSLIVLRDLQAISDSRIPDMLLARAEGIIILPANVKVGLWFGASFGSGVMLVRNPDRSWSNPVFVKTGGGSWGLQFGGQVSDIVLVLTTRESIEGITDGKLTLGADASAAAGPVGRTAMAGTSITFDAEVYAYSKTQGLFAGVSLEGNGIFIWKKAN